MSNSATSATSTSFCSVSIFRVEFSGGYYIVTDNDYACTQRCVICVHCMTNFTQLALNGLILG